VIMNRGTGPCNMLNVKQMCDIPNFIQLVMPIAVNFLFRIVHECSRMMWVSPRMALSQNDSTGVEYIRLAD
jgi:hypothetical protein